MDDQSQKITLPTLEDPCEHVMQLGPVTPTGKVCQPCMEWGDRWVHLRVCMTCGFVGCCDSSKNKHATKHHHKTGHPVIMSLEPGEEWVWCYADDTLVI